MALSVAAFLKKLNLLECHRSHHSPWLQTPVWRRRTNQICYYWFSEIFHVLCHGFCCIFSARIISVAEKDLHVVNSNFLSPSYSFLHCRVIRQYLIWSINSRHTVVVDINNIWSPFGFSTPVDWIHHCWHVSTADETNIPFILSLSYKNVIKWHENHLNLLKLLSNYVWCISLSISLQGTSNIPVPHWHILCEWYRILPVVSEQMVAFVILRLYEVYNKRPCLPKLSSICEFCPRIDLDLQQEAIIHV